MEEAESYNFCCKTRLLSVEFVQPLAALDLQRDGPWSVDCGEAGDWHFICTLS
jgi:hypothetical protein